MTIKRLSIPYEDTILEYPMTVCTLNDHPDAWGTVFRACVNLFGADFYMNENYKHMTGVEQVVALLVCLKADKDRGISK